MNVLDAPEVQQIESRNCKMHYLSIENKLLALKYSTIQNIICIYKEVINIVSSPSAEEDSGAEKERQLIKLLAKAEKYTERCQQDCKQVQNSRQFASKLEEPYLDTDFFSQVVRSYETTISELRSQIKHRELTLQELETNENHPLKRKEDSIKESRAAMKAIQTYDIYLKISEKCKMQISQLKCQKNKFQNVSVLGENKNHINTGKSLLGNEEANKTMKKVPTSLHDDLSAFEKTVLVYKKKKLLNKILEKKVIELKKKINEKQQCNQALQKILEGEVWDFNSMTLPESRNVDQGNNVYLSMVNESIAGSKREIQGDISKILPDSVKASKKSEKAASTQTVSNSKQRQEK